MASQERARRSAAAMWAGDCASKDMGLELGPVGPGTATLTMTVEKRHLNGHGICHGGYIFSLADTAFAFACNSYNRVAVAQHNTISYLVPVQLGDILTASATETSKSGRTGVYDVQVKRSDGEVIALFRGCSRIIDGVHFEE